MGRGDTLAGRMVAGPGQRLVDPAHRVPVGPGQDRLRDVAQLDPEPLLVQGRPRPSGWSSWTAVSRLYPGSWAGTPTRDDPAGVRPAPTVSTAAAPTTPAGVVEGCWVN